VKGRILVGSIGPVLVCLAAGVWAQGAPDSLEQRVRALIAQLDAADFAARNDATRQLAAQGPRALPTLVAALGDESREVRFRVQGLLTQQFSFDDVVAPLIAALPRSYGPAARAILRDRALMQIEDAGNMQFARQLFEFWNTDVEEFRRRVLFNIPSAQTPQEVADIVEPLVGLKAKAALFEDVLSRLETLSLSYDHRHSPGFVVAETLATGLRTHSPERTGFAQRYLRAFETLSGQVQAQGQSRAALRKEITDRANMSDGASAYLVQLLDPQSPPSRILTARTGIAPARLADEFFRGLAEADAKECYRCVGKVHIADMLTTVLASWPDAPTDGLVQTLCAGVEATIGPGDKPKALVLLDALEACRDLAAQGLDCRAGVGQQLAHRLHMAVVVCATTRDYHPVRSTHDRFLRLHALGVTPDHPAFPGQVWQSYLAGDAAATEEEQRMALTQYVSVVEQLIKAEAALDAPGTQPFLALLRAHLQDQRAVVTDGSREFARLIDTVRSAPDADGARRTLDEALGQWAQQRKGSG